MLMKLGQIAYAPEGVGGGGGEPGTLPANPPAGGAAEHPVSAPWTNDGVWKVGEGEAAKEWWNALPDEAARKHVEAKQYANPAELALANYNLTRLQTGDPQVLALPAKDAGQDQWDAFYNKLGRPETPDGYEFTFGEGVQTDENMVKFGKELFHELGVPKEKAQAAADKWNGFVAEQTAAMLEADRTANENELNDLTTRWGPDLEKNKAAGQRVVQALGLDASLIERVENNIGSAAVVELLAQIGRKSDEGGFTNSNQGGDPNNPDLMDKTQAQEKITQLQGDAEFQKKYTDAKHPAHAEAVKLMERLYSRI